MRLDRPIGWWLLLMPCWWGLALGRSRRGAARRTGGTLLLFLIGAIVMRGAGCTLNDIVDREIDAKVARTRRGRYRRGQVSAASAALVFLIGQCLAGLAVLLQFNWFTVFARRIVAGRSSRSIPS